MIRDAGFDDPVAHRQVLLAPDPVHWTFGAPDGSPTAPASARVEMKLVGAGQVAVTPLWQLSPGPQLLVLWYGTSSYPVMAVGSVLSLLGEPSVTTMIEFCWQPQQIEHWFGLLWAQGAFTRPAVLPRSVLRSKLEPNLVV